MAQRAFICVPIILSLAALGFGTPSPRDAGLSGRSVFLSNRTDCGVGDAWPSNRVNTSERVTNLMAELVSNGYAAYIIPTGDSHQSEYPPEADRRRAYISGFSGSAGTAVVLSNGTRALWTDGRYFLEADQQLDCHWLFMKTGQAGVPSIEEFLVEYLTAGDVAATDGTAMGYGDWLSYNSTLAANGISFESSSSNLVDAVWENDVSNPRPPYSQDKAFVHPIEYAGKNVSEKLTEVRNALTEAEADALFVTALDDIAWLFNIRGRDVPFNPVLIGYALVTKTEATLYVNISKVSNVTDHLQEFQVIVKSYEEALTDLAAYSSTPSVNKVLLPNSQLTPGCSYRVYEAVEASKRSMVIPPTLTLKAQKNSVEIEKMLEAHVYDGVALCDFLAMLEEQVVNGEGGWTEVSAQEELTLYRAEQNYYIEDSFGPISGYGPHGAVIHYGATEDTDVPIETNSLYLLDSGGQYLGGTTDVTRTLHFGTPTPEMIDMYTRVLIGVIDFAAIVFPAGTTSGEIDVLARRAIWEAGLDYRHGTSHGIGMLLNVHEPKLSTYQPGYVMSDEPGYYKDGYWGIRIESQIYCIETQMEFDQKFYKFDHMTVVPFEPKLINVDLLSDNQLEWLNDYSLLVRETVGSELQAQGRDRGYQWVLSKTEPLLRSGGESKGAKSVTVMAALMSSLARYFAS